MLLQIRRQSGTNTVEVVNGVKEKLAELQATLPAGYSARVVRDLGEFIEASIDDVEEHLVVGSILAALVVMLFLWNIRSTLIAAIAIPTSIIATFGLIWYMGFTLNAMTMLALTLAVGIVIDDAIVVLENIYRFMEEKGIEPRTAAVEATQEIGLAVLATTLSLVAIFVPVAFMGGIVGRFMESFGLTMAFAIMVSLLVSFTLTPMMAARWLKVDHGKSSHASKDSWIFHAVDAWYTRMLEWSMAHRAIVAGVAVLVLLSSVPLFMVASKNFMPVDDQAEFEINLRAPEGTSLESTEVIANRIANAVRAGVPEVDYTLVTVGGDQSATRNLGTIYVRLTGIHQRDRDQFVLMGVVRDEILPPLAQGLRTSVQQVATIGGGGSQNADVQFLINGPDLKALEEIGRQMVDEVKKTPWRRGRGFVAERRQARAVGPSRSAQGVGPRGADLGRSRGAPPAGRRRPGDDVQRGQRAVRSAPSRQSREPVDGGRHRCADRAFEPAGQRAARQRGAVHGGDGPVRRQPPGPAAAGHDLRQRAAWRIADRGPDRDADGFRSAQPRRRLQRRLYRPFEGAGTRGREFRARVRAVAGLHVSDPRCAVRVVAPSDHDSPVAAAHAALCAPLDHRLRAVAEHLFRARTAGALRRREEELDPADRPRQPAAGDGSLYAGTPSFRPAGIGCVRF